MLLQERGVLLRRAGHLLRRHLQPGLEHQPPRDRLVVAPAHRDRRRQLAQALAANHRTPAEAQREVPSLRIDHLDPDAAPPGLVDDDHGVGVDRLVGRRPDIELFVDRVLGFQGEHRHPLETQLLVKRYGVDVVVHHRQVHEAPPARLEMLRQRPHQVLADAGKRRLRIDRQTPQRRPVLRVLERPRMIDPGDRPDDVVGSGIDRHEIRQDPAVALVVEEVRRHLDHVAAGIDAVDRLGILDRPEPPHGEPARPPPAGAIVRQPQPVRMGRIEEKLLRRQRQRHMGIAQVQRDIAPSLRLFPQRLRQFRQVGEGMGEQQPAPAAIDRDVLRQPLLIGMLLVLYVPVAERRRVAPLKPVLRAGMQRLKS